MSVDFPAPGFSLIQSSIALDLDHVIRIRCILNVEDSHNSLPGRKMFKEPLHRRSIRRITVA